MAISFEEQRGALEEALKKKAQEEPYHTNEAAQGFILTTGFLPLVQQQSIGKDVGYAVGGYILPAIVAVGKRTGQVYCFPVKVLLPDVDF